MASAVVFSLRGRIQKHASREDLLSSPLPSLPFASRGRPAQRDRTPQDRPSPRAVKITLTLLVLSMLGTLAVLNNLMRAELAREWAERQAEVDAKGGAWGAPGSAVQAPGALDEGGAAEEAAAKAATEEGLVQRESAAAAGVASQPVDQAGAARASRLLGHEACELVLNTLRGGADVMAAASADARCLREQTDAHAADTTTAMEDKRTCRRITQLAVEERDGGLLEWNATGTEHQLPSVDVMSAAWHADKVIVLRGGAAGFGATGKWDGEFLLAHSPATSSFRVRRSKFHDGVYHFNSRDFEVATMSFAQFLKGAEAGEELYLAETPVASFGTSPPQQHEMLRDLQPPALLSLALAAMGVPADRCMPVRHQLWMGNGLKVNPLHQDPYDNLLLQLSGEKHFTLFAPSQRWWLYPTFPPGGHESSLMNDIRGVDLARFPCFQFARPVTLTLRAGDVLLLPYAWWHQVQTTGRSLAVNYWWTRDSMRSCAPWPSAA